MIWVVFPHILRENHPDHGNQGAIKISALIIREP